MTLLLLYLIFCCEGSIHRWFYNSTGHGFDINWPKGKFKLQVILMASSWQ